MKSKKIFALTMACMMGFGALAGCAKKKDEILNWRFFAAMYGSEINDGNEIQELIAKDTGIRVKETWLVGQTASEAIGSIVVSGDLPEFIDGGDGCDDLYKAGLLVAWDDYLAKPEYSNLKEMYSDDEWEKFRKEDGHIYWANVFNNSWEGKPVSHGYNDEAFWIQARVLEWANYPVIETLDDYFDLLEKYYEANKTNPDGTKIIPYTCLCEDWRYFCIENAGQFLDGYPNDGSVLVMNPDSNPTIGDYNTTPTTKRYFQKLNEIYHKEMMDKEFAVQTYDQYMAKLSTGAVLGMCDQWWDFSATVNDNFKQQGFDKLGYNYVPMGPTIEKGMKNRWYCGVADTLNHASGISVTTSCKDPDKAFKFLNRMLDQDIHNLRFWGVKDVDYVVDESTKVMSRTQAQRDQWADPNYQKSHVCAYGYFPQWGGMSRDGINTMNPNDSDSEFFAGMAEPLKKCFDAYGFTSYWQFLRSDLTQPVYPWYPMYSYSNNLKTDNDAGVAWTKMGECKHQWLPEVVMADDFEAKWAEYQEAYAACKPEDFLKYMQEQLDTYKK